ncbi:hypothetical protein NKG94_00585 [Micromonospora sp. M12]
MFCANDLIALGVLQELTARGVRCRPTWPSSATTTSSSPAPLRCHCRRCASPRPARPRRSRAVARRGRVR